MPQNVENILLEHVPSRRKLVLDQIVNQKLKSIVKLLDPSHIPFLEKYHPDLSQNQYFSEGGGSVELSFENGLVVGFQSNEYLCSIMLNMIQNKDGSLVLNTKAIEKRKKEHEVPDPITVHAGDTKYSEKRFLKFIGKGVKSIGVIKRKIDEIDSGFYPYERAVVLHFNDCADLFISRDLGSVGDLPTIHTADQIHPGRLAGYKEYDYHEIEEWYPPTDEVTPTEWDWKYWRPQVYYEGIKLNIGTDGKMCQQLF